MPTYIMLSRLSPEGLTTLKRNPSRLNEVNREVEQFGARVVQQYALLGAYDFITVLEAPDSETVARISVELGSRRTASYETLTAIPVEEFISASRTIRLPARSLAFEAVLKAVSARRAFANASLDLARSWLDAPDSLIHPRSLVG